MICCLFYYTQTANHYYEELIHWLARLQETSTKIAYKHVIKMRKFEHQAMLLEVDEFLRFLRILEYSDDKLELIRLHFSQICQEITRSQPFSVIHRDFQSKNIMIHNDQPFVIDFQDVSLGPILYDLASLLYDQNACLNSLERQRLAKIYWENYGTDLKTKIGGYPEFLRILRLTGLQRNIKSIGRHATLYYVKGKKERMSSIKRGLQVLNSLRDELREEGLLIFQLIDSVKFDLI